jgi:hypothetical protein
LLINKKGELKLLKIPHPSKSVGRKRDIEYYINENGCWICVSHSRDRDGYPRIHLNYKHKRMSHVIYKYFYGVEVEKPYMLLHNCDNPNCINPEHLRIGSNAENMKDKSIRKRIHGERNPKAKLTIEQVEVIRNKEKSVKDLSLMFGVSKTQIYYIQKGKSWT